MTSHRERRWGGMYWVGNDDSLENSIRRFYNGYFLMKRIATSGEKCNHIAQFNYKGFSCKQLEDLCNPQNGNHGRAPWMFWTAELYSSGKYMRDYAHLPSFLPLNCYTDHGPGVYSRSIPPHELDNNAPVQFINLLLKYADLKKFHQNPVIVDYHLSYGAEKKIKLNRLPIPVEL